MHELGMCQAVLDAVEHRAAGRPVERIGVEAGEQLAVVPEVFEQGLQVLAQGGVADGVTAEVTTTPGDGLTLVWVRYRDGAATPPVETVEPGHASVPTTGGS